MNRRAFAIGASAMLGKLLAQSTLGGKASIGGLFRMNDNPSLYIFSVGQSLSTGGAGDPALTTSQPYNNEMWNGGDIASWWSDFDNPIASIDHLVPLIEGVSHDDESHCSAFANSVSALARADGRGSSQDSIGTSFGLGGTAYSGLKKGTAPYNSSIASVTRLKLLNNSIRVPAIVCVHGETDGSCAYIDKVVEWQSDYESDIKAITGQSGIIPMLISQVQSGECASAGFPMPPEPTYTGMLGAYEQNPTKILLVNPKYIFPYVVGGTHLTNQGYRWMGEYYAKAYYQHVVQGQQWSPLRPTAVSIDSNHLITIQFYVPVPPLVFDTTNVAQLADGHYGFEWFTAGSETISSVQITDANAGIVQIQLSGAPVGGDGFPLRYAYTGTATGPTTGCRGCLRDSDPSVGLDGNHLYNWCVHFSKLIPFP
jgi:hypothetical protein